MAKIDALAPFAIDFYEDVSPTCLYTGCQLANV